MIIDISPQALALCYLLLIFPLAITLWLKLPILGSIATAVIRMTVQLLLVGLYLHYIFDLDSLWLTILWLVVMIGVADISITRGCKLCFKCLAMPLFVSLLTGTAIPLIFFTDVALNLENTLSAQYAIPIGGMILGNCLRADVVGIQTFYQSMRDKELLYRLALSQGATRSEAMLPFLRDAFQAALSPTIASIATIGLVSLPGMMTGVILGGNDPSVAIKYQIAIMLAIFSGTSITVFMGLLLTIPNAFTSGGSLREDIFLNK